MGYGADPSPVSAGAALLRLRRPERQAEGDADRETTPADSVLDDLADVAWGRDAELQSLPGTERAVLDPDDPARLDRLVQSDRALAPPRGGLALERALLAPAAQLGLATLRDSPDLHPEQEDARAVLCPQDGHGRVDSRRRRRSGDFRDRDGGRQARGVPGRVGRRHH